MVSVIMGALGDHGFDLTREQSESMDTAIRYNMIYAVLIVALALGPPEKKLHLPISIFTLGTFLFAFSIYASLMSGIDQLTYITPIGGVTLMVGWATLIYKALKPEQ